MAGTLLGLAINAVRWGAADFYAKEAYAYTVKFSEKQGNSTIDDWQAAYQAAQTALAFNANDADVYHRIGILYSLAADYLADSKEQQQLYREKALLHYQLSLSLRPTFSAVWANLAVVKYKQGQFDALFEQALVNAAKTGGWQVYPMQLVVELGINSWFRLSGAGRQMVINTLVRSLQLKKIAKITATMLRNSRYRLALCRTGDLPESIELLCKK